MPDSPNPVNISITPADPPPADLQTPATVMNKTVLDVLLAERLLTPEQYNDIKVKSFEVPDVEISDHLPLILEFLYSSY